MQRREEKLEGEEANGDHRGAHQTEEKRMVPTARHGAAGVGAELPRMAGGRRRCRVEIGAFRGVPAVARA